jgi:quercetin dioxygenase-like cupin family protein
MSHLAQKGRLGRSLALLGLVLGTSLAASAAFAADCPPDQVAEGARTSGETVAVGVTDEIIGSIDMSPKGPAFKGYLLRMRKLVVAPGGVVPWHQHDERAANILILEGTIVEYRSNCKVGIEHGPGDVASEYGKGLAHWWKNESDKPVVIISADLLPPTMDPSDSM